MYEGGKQTKISLFLCVSHTFRKIPIKIEFDYPADRCRISMARTPIFNDSDTPTNFFVRLPFLDMNWKKNTYFSCANDIFPKWVVLCIFLWANWKILIVKIVITLIDWLFGNVMIFLFEKYSRVIHIRDENWIKWFKQYHVCYNNFRETRFFPFGQM